MALRGSGESSLEATFALQLRAWKLPAAQRNYQFLPDRKLEFDFAWPDQHVAVEIQGNVHRIKAMFYRDTEKMCLALVAGWRVLPLSRREIMDWRGVGWVAELLKIHVADRVSSQA